MNNTYFLPTRVNEDKISPSHSDNAPAFFTGLTRTIVFNQESHLTSSNTVSSGNKYARHDQQFQGGDVSIHSNVAPSSTPNLQLKRKQNFEEANRKRFIPSSDFATPNSKHSGNSSKDIDYYTPNQNSAKRKISYPDHSGKKFQPSPTFRLSTSNLKLNNEIWDLYWNAKQTDEKMDRKMNLRTKLHEILLTKFPTCGLYVVGSSMTSLGDNHSDMDMCMMLTDDEVDQKMEARSILSQVRSLFYKHRFICNMQLIPAIVPILKLRDAVSGVEVDLNVNNTVGIRNTQLLSSYARIDERLCPLVLVVKSWARFHNINDAKHNSLSSYSIVLMVIHFLQYRCNPPVLPCLQKLQPDKFNPSQDIRSLKLTEELPDFTSENHDNLGDLFIGFLKYFSTEFNYQKSVMSVRLGSVLEKRSVMTVESPKNKPAHWKHICIEEPFDLTNTARAVFRDDIFKYILNVFHNGWYRLKNSGSLQSILT